MADKMMRISGRGADGTAKAIKTDNNGNIEVQLSNSMAKSNIVEKMSFVNKKASSVVESPHVAKYLQNSSNASPTSPDSFTLEISDTNYARIGIKDIPAGVFSLTTTQSAKYPLHLFSFDLLADLKNKGKIPKSWTLTELVSALKKISFEWIGYAEGSNGGVLANGATLKLWDNAAWTTIGTNNTSTYSSVIGTLSFANLVQNNGLLHFIVNPNYPSDGTITGKILTDYISIDVEFATDVVLTDFSRAYDSVSKSLKTISTMTKSALQKRTKLTTALTVLLSTSTVILDNYEFTDNVTAWALYGYEITRPISHLVDGQLQLLIEFSNTSNGFDDTTNGNMVFKKYVDFSSSDESDKGLLSISSSVATTGINIMASGEAFNVPLAKYMRLTLVNNTPTVSFRFLPLSLVEEGNF